MKTGYINYQNKREHSFPLEGKTANEGKMQGMALIVPFSYKYNPISFGKPKETGLYLKEKFF